MMSKAYHKSYEVRWDDADFNGHLRNTRYLEYASNTRLHFLMELGWDARALQKEGIASVLLGEEATYLREVFLAERVIVSCEVVGLSEDRARWRTRHTVTRERGGEAAVVHCLGAWLDVHERRITPPPAGLRAVFEQARSDDCEVIGGA
ncbi:acyl-CoA thioester hydrolase [Streptomyces sp. SAI-229]